MCVSLNVKMALLRYLTQKNGADEAKRGSLLEKELRKIDQKVKEVECSKDKAAPKSRGTYNAYMPEQRA